MPKVLTSDQRHSPRVELARLALSTATDHPSVVGSSAGLSGIYVTVINGERLEGVISVAEPAGDAYRVGLRLTTRLVPLPALSTELRMGIRAAVERSPRAGRLGPIDIEFVDIELDEGEL